MCWRVDDVLCSSWESPPITNQRHRATHGSSNSPGSASNQSCFPLRSLIFVSFRDGCFLLLNGHACFRSCFLFERASQRHEVSVTGCYLCSVQREYIFEPTRELVHTTSTLHCIVEMYLHCVRVTAVSPFFIVENFSGHRESHLNLNDPEETETIPVNHAHLSPGAFVGILL